MGGEDVVVVLENEERSEAEFMFDFTEHHVTVLRTRAYRSHVIISPRSAPSSRLRPIATSDTLAKIKLGSRMKEGRGSTGLASIPCWYRV